MSLSSADIKIIIETLQESDWDEAVVVVGDVRIAVARNGASLSEAGDSPAPAVAPVSAAPAAAAPVAVVPAPAAAPAVVAPPVIHAPTVAVDGYLVESPSVGVFWRSSEPGAAPFVEVGARVRAGETLCIIEIMKLMNNVTADVSGVIAAIHVDNAAMVEFGTPLFTIQHEA